LGRRRQDAFGKRARREGFPARSVYKLEEIDRRTRILRHGQRVLDLGAAPGSWTMYAADKVGPTGRVLGFDLTPFDGALPAHAEIRVGDAFEIDLDTLGEEPFDVVLSDMAPATSGQKHADQWKSYELAMRALDIAKRTLRPGGAFVAKIFQGPDVPAAQKAVKEAFAEMRIIRPKAVRTESYEVFLVGTGKK
jgi:23S rRNA (uridine2552-2'-O)-methyltransferase